MRAREEGGSRGSSAGGWRAAGRQAGGLAGWLGEGCIGLGWPGSLGQDYFGLLAGVEAAWQPPSLPLSPWASLSLHLTVFCNALSAIPAVWSSPAASAHPSCSEPPTIRLYEAPAPPASPFPCLSLGPCFCPVSSSLLSPPPNVCVYLSVCQRGLSGHRLRLRVWESSPCSRPPGASTTGNGCCLAAPTASLEGLGPQLPLPPSQLRPSLQETSEGHKPGTCGVWVFPLWVPSACSAVGIEASRSSGVTVPYSS